MLQCIQERFVQKVSVLTVQSYAEFHGAYLQTDVTLEFLSKWMHLANSSTTIRKFISKYLLIISILLHGRVSEENDDW